MHELAISDFLEGEAVEIITRVLGTLTGSAPRAQYIEDYVNNSSDGGFAFVSSVLQNWPGAEFHPAPLLSNSHEVRKLMSSRISTRFLQSVPTEVFLEICFLEIFERPYDEKTFAGFPLGDLSDPSVRLEVIAKLLASANEAGVLRKKVFGTQEDLIALQKLTSEHFQWEPYSAGEIFGGERGDVVTEAYSPVILWIAERNILYTLPGVQFSGKLVGNCLKAKPEWAIWGPKVTLPFGQYRLRLEITGSRNDHFILDAAGRGGSIIYDRWDYFGSMSIEAHLKFESDAEDFEVRLFNMNGRDVDVQILEISLMRI